MKKSEMKAFLISVGVSVLVVITSFVYFKLCFNHMEKFEENSNWELDSKTELYNLKNISPSLNDSYLDPKMASNGYVFYEYVTKSKEGTFDLNKKHSSDSTVLHIPKDENPYMETYVKIDETLLFDSTDYYYKFYIPIESVD